MNLNNEQWEYFTLWTSYKQRIIYVRKSQSTNFVLFEISFPGDSNADTNCIILWKKLTGSKSFESNVSETKL